MFGHCTDHLCSDSEDEVDMAVDVATLEKIQTVLFSQSTGPFYAYTHVPWLLQIRKEVGPSTPTCTGRGRVDGS